MSLLQNHLDMDDSHPVDRASNDTDLVAQARAGDGHAFTSLYRRHVPSVYRYALFRLHLREDAEDATQVIFLRAAQSLDQCRSDDAFVGWLFAIARNVITDKQRVRKIQTFSLVEDDEIEDPRTRPDELAIRSAQREELREARSRCLNDADREFFDLLIADLTYDEMAVALNKRVGAIRTRYWRLLDRLRACLERGAPREGRAS